MRSSRISKEEILSFLLTHIVIEKGYHFQITPGVLFELMNLAAEAESRVADEDDSIPHEIIEDVAQPFLTKKVVAKKAL